MEIRFCSKLACHDDFHNGNIFSCPLESLDVLWTGQGFMFDIALNILTSSNGNIFGVTGPLWGEFTGHHAQRPVTQSFDVFFDLHLNKLLSKPWRRWWIETSLRPLWRHCNDFNVCLLMYPRYATLDGSYKRMILRFPLTYERPLQA